MFNPGFPERRCAVCSSGTGLGAIPSSARTSYVEMRTILQRRANAARTASPSAWSSAEDRLAEAIRAAGTMESEDYYADRGSWVEWDTFVETLDRSRYALASQREARAQQTTITGEETGGPPNPATGGGARVPPRPGKTYTPPGERDIDPSAQPKQAGVGAGLSAMLRSPWALAGLLGVGAVVAVWYATSDEGK
jgi:hypothetical protein